MKVLFISSRDVKWTTNGGELCTNRNYNSFVKLLGDDNVTVINLMSKKKRPKFHPLLKRINYIFGFYEGVTKKYIKKIINISCQYELIFIDTSLYGTITKHLRKSKYKGKIVCFFHNVEFKVRFQRFKENPFKLIEVYLAYNNEKQALKNSDEIVVLNNRDYNELKSIYKIEPKVKVIPISLMDRYRLVKEEFRTSLPPVFLFTGNNWYANVHGLKWFISNVLDDVNIILQITGKDMGKYKRIYNNEKIRYLGFVDNIDEVIIKADFILLPLFKGGGMKVKTCDALMFGKNIIGTKEAFEGYEIDADKVGAVCNTKEEFIKEIKKVSVRRGKKFNNYSREIYLKKYSFEATLKYFSQLLYE